MKQSFVQVITTVSEKKDAEILTKAIMNKRLGACVQIAGPVESVYRWKGRIETAKEFVCIIKTRKDLYKKVEKQIKELHPYEIPEIISISITEGNMDYLRWLSDETA